MIRYGQRAEYLLRAGMLIFSKGKSTETEYFDRLSKFYFVIAGIDWFAFADDEVSLCELVFV